MHVEMIDTGGAYKDGPLMQKIFSGPSLYATPYGKNCWVMERSTRKALLSNPWSKWPM